MAGTVFLCRAHGQQRLLEAAAEDLARAGVRVLRDPVHVSLGERRHYTPAEAASLLRGAERRLRQGQPKPPYPTARALHGKTVGFIGFGRIAQAMAERLLPFGVPMLACSRRPPPPTPGVRAVDLDTLLRESDVVCVLVTLNRDSRGMLGERELALMKPTAHLVNTGRGEAIDEAALYRALRERRIASAALDTFAVEPLPADSPLRTLDNVILTPHMVGQTREAADEFGPILVDNIRRLLRGELPRYCKNPEIAPRWRQRFGTPAGT